MNEFSFPDAMIALLAAEEVKPDPWESSPWQEFVTKPPASKGSIGAYLAGLWLQHQDLSVSGCPDPDADLVVDGLRVEVKLSTLWKEGVFRFQQLRRQDWDVLVAVGVEPHEFRVWVMSQEEALANAEGQHTGAKASETYWLSWKAGDAPEFTGSAVGDLEVAWDRFVALHPALSGRAAGPR